MTDLSRIRLPDRPLAVRPAEALADRLLWPLAVMVLVLAVFGGVMSRVVPDLELDAMIMESAAIVPGGKVTDGGCKNTLGLVLCRVGLSAPGPRGTEATASRVLLFLADPGEKDFPFNVMADPKRPYDITTSLGLYHYDNRLMVVLGLSAGLVIAVALLIRVVHGRWVVLRELMAAFKAGPARPVALGFRRRHRRAWEVTDGSGRARVWPIMPPTLPMLLDAEGTVILGVTPDGVHVLPVDAQGRFLRLTPEELEALHASLPAGSPVPRDRMEA